MVGTRRTRGLAVAFTEHDLAIAERNAKQARIASRVAARAAAQARAAPPTIEDAAAEEEAGRMSAEDEEPVGPVIEEDQPEEGRAEPPRLDEIEPVPPLDDAAAGGGAGEVGPGGGDEEDTNAADGPDAPIVEPPASESEQDQLIIDMVGVLGGVGVPHPDLIEYVREYCSHQDHLATRIQDMITAMIASAGVGDVWKDVLPMNAFLLNWPGLIHPWVYDDTPEVRWLQDACRLCRAGATTTQLERLLNLYKDFKVLASPPSYTLVPPADWAGESLQDHLTALEDQIWNFAIQGSAHYMDRADDVTALRNQLTARSNTDITVRGSAVRLTWDVLWTQVRAALLIRGTSPPIMTRFDILFGGAYTIASMSGRFRLPPRLTDGMAPNSFCDLIESDRLELLESLGDDWTQGNFRIRNEDDESFEQRRVRFLDEVEPDDYNGWGYGPYDEALWPTNRMKTNGGYQERLQNEVPVDDNLWTEINELEYANRRFSIQLLLPYWPRDMAAGTYIVSRVKSETFRRAIELMNPLWQIAILQAEAAADGLGDFDPDVAFMRNRFSEVLADATSLSNYPIGPDQVKLEFAWDKLYQNLPPQGRLPATKGRIDDLRRDAVDANWRYNDEVIMPLSMAVNESLERYYSRLSPHVRDTLESHTFASWNAAIGKAEEGPPRDAITEQFGDMQTFFNTNGIHYRYGELIPVIPARSAAGRRLGPGSGRGAPDGSWKYVGPAGEGGYGHAGVWALENDAKQVGDRIVIKETYLTRSWNRSWHWHFGRNWRIPWEFEIVSKLNSLQDSGNIVHYTSFGIYESVRMYRLYMEECALEAALSGK